ncbi:MAG TPA: carboxypeptidase-like regulatory domain-containing protein [Vicinamibacteria bacterium]
MPELVVTRRARLAFGLLLLAVPAVALAEDPVSGQVLDQASGAPLAGVRVSVELSRRSVTLPAPTDAAGHFALDPARLFNPTELDTDGVSFLFEKDGYRGATKVKLLAKRGEVRIASFAVRLEPLAASAARSCDQEATLGPLRSSDGRTLFVVPYDLGSPERSRDFNDRLLQTLKRRIQTHLQELNLDVALGDVGLRSLPGQLGAADTEKIRACGGAVNALAVAAGRVTPIDRGADVAVESEFVIIPALARYRPGSLSIDDRLPVGELTASALSRRLHSLWGRSTLLALAIAEARDALTAHDNGRLEKARAWLTAERAQAGPGSETLMQSISELLRLIDAELAR